jgi:hypothetical protein
VDVSVLKFLFGLIIAPRSSSNECGTPHIYALLAQHNHEQRSMVVVERIVSRVELRTLGYASVTHLGLVTIGGGMHVGLSDRVFR